MKRRLDIPVEKGKLCPREGGVFLLLTPFRKTIMAEDLEGQKMQHGPLAPPHAKTCDCDGDHKGHGSQFVTV